MFKNCLKCLKITINSNLENLKSWCCNLEVLKYWLVQSWFKISRLQDQDFKTSSFQESWICNPTYNRVCLSRTALNEISCKDFTVYIDWFFFVKISKWIKQTSFLNWPYFYLVSSNLSFFSNNIMRWHGKLKLWTVNSIIAKPFVVKEK